jgi:hypothetical protein
LCRLGVRKVMLLYRRDYLLTGKEVCHSSTVASPSSGSAAQLDRANVIGAQQKHFSRRNSASCPNRISERKTRVRGRLRSRGRRRHTWWYLFRRQIWADSLPRSNNSRKSTKEAMTASLSSGTL